MDVWSILIISSNCDGGSNSRFRDLANLDSPVILWLFKIGEPVLALTVRDDKINTFWTQDPVNL
jgi:hypothetical protein